MTKKIKEIIKNAIDLHVHIGPEIIPRKYTVETLVQEEKGKLYGIVLKNHFYPTGPLVKSANVKNIKLFGSIVLNNFVGGLNKEAVYSASLILESPLIVWFPTINADNFLKQSIYEIPPEWIKGSLKNSRRSNLVKNLKILDKNNKINIEALEVLRVIKEANSILATGHISWQESVVLVEKAQELGIENIIVTHPIYQRINMPIKIQKQLASKGAKIELCYSMYSIDNISMESITKQIEDVGVSNCLLSSDVGQKFSLSPSQALYDFAGKLNSLGLSSDDLEIMLIKNPWKLVGMKA